jgi:MFS transporter, UMF1 family
MAGDRKKEIWAWCWYDFANSAFSTIIVTVAYSIYFAQVVAKGHNAESWWGWGYGLSMLAIGLVSPVLGALADYSGTKKRYLILFTLLSVLATGMLVVVSEGDVWLGILLFGLANIGFNGGLTFYNAFLKDLSRSDNMGRISGYGFALGYIGGLVSLLLVFPLIKGGFDPDNLLRYRLSFPVTAVFFLVFSIPAFIYLKEERTAALRLTLAAAFRTGFQRVWATFHEIRKFRELFKFFVAYLIYIDGINTVIVFSAIFAGGVLGFSPQELVIYFIIMQITSAGGAYVFGFITDRIGAKKTILITLLMWIALIIWAFIVGSKAEFYALGLIAGVALGANQSASRTLLGLFAPRIKVTEFFGFFSLTGKLAAVFGPIVYGEIASRSGNQRLAVLSIGAFFLVGLFLLLTVRQEAGIAAAERADG